MSLNCKPKEDKQGGEAVVWPPGTGHAPAVSQFLVMIPLGALWLLIEVVSSL